MGQVPCQLTEALLLAKVRDGQKVAHQIQVHVLLFRDIGGLVAVTFVEVLRPDPQHLGENVQPCSRKSVQALLVLVHLLAGNAHKLGQLLLRQPERAAEIAHSSADVVVDLDGLSGPSCRMIARDGVAVHAPGGHA